MKNALNIQIRPICQLVTFILWLATDSLVSSGPYKVFDTYSFPLHSDRTQLQSNAVETSFDSMTLKLLFHGPRVAQQDAQQVFSLIIMLIWVASVADAL